MNHQALTSFTSQVIRTNTIVGNIVELVLVRPAGFKWQAGDYLWLGINEQTLKPFSIANVMMNDTQTIHFDIALTEPLNDWWQQLIGSSHCIIKGPVNQYYWPTGNMPMYLLAGGTGITPLLALLNAHEPELKDRVVSLYWGVRQSELLFVKDQLDQLANHYTKFHWQAVISEEEPNWLGAKGYLPDLLSQSITHCNDYEWLICGPWPMVKSLKAWLETQTVDSDHIQ